MTCVMGSAFALDRALATSTASQCLVSESVQGCMGLGFSVQGSILKDFLAILGVEFRLLRSVGLWAF